MLGVTAPDAKHDRLEAQGPGGLLPPQLTPAQTGNFWPVPKETDSTFDNRKDLIGTGPFVLTNTRPSIGMTFKRNPDYWDTSKGPVFDTSSSRSSSSTLRRSRS